MPESAMKMIEMEMEGTTLEAVVEIAQRGDSVVLKKAGQPIAQVNHISTGGTMTRRSPLHPKAWEVSADFDEPLPDEFWVGKE